MMIYHSTESLKSHQQKQIQDNHTLWPRSGPSNEKADQFLAEPVMDGKTNRPRKTPTNQVWDICGSHGYL